MADWLWNYYTEGTFRGSIFTLVTLQEADENYGVGYIKVSPTHYLNCIGHAMVCCFPLKFKELANLFLNTFRCTQSPVNKYN